jgi:intergrase/recombinase
MPVEDAVTNFLIEQAKEDYSKFTDEELEKKRHQLEIDLINKLKPYLSRKEYDKIQKILKEMLDKVDSSIYDARYAEKVKRTLRRVINFCHAWERLKK